MNEVRFEKISENHDIYMADDAPIWILAYALLRDTLKDSLIAQVKLKSISRQQIVEVVLDIKCYDVANVPLPGVSGFSFRNLLISRDEVFGQKIPIVLSNKHTRSIRPIITKIVFADGSAWNAGEDCSADILPAQVRLLDAWNNDTDLVSQFHIETATIGEYLPDITSHFWRCSCGEINTQAEDVCFSCGAGKESQFSVISNTDWLQDRSAFRVEEERIMSRRKCDKWCLKLVPRWEHARPKGHPSALLFVASWMKRHLKWILAIVATLLVILTAILVFGSGRRRENNDQSGSYGTVTIAAMSPTPSATLSPAPTLAPTETPTNTNTNESIRSEVEQILVDNPLYINCEIDDKKLIANFYAPEDTIEMLSSYNSSAAVQQEWASYVEKISELSKAMGDAISRLGGVQVGAVFIRNDTNYEKILLVCANGEVLYNVIDELD